MMSNVRAAIAERLDLSAVGETDTVSSQIANMTKREIDDFFRSVQAALPIAHRAQSDFSYLGNSELSGFTTINSSYKSRATRLKEACYFSACYADQLVLHDPFFQLLSSFDEDRITPSFIQEFSFFISALIMMEPLIERQLISFCEPEGSNLCTKCFLRLAGESDDVTPFTTFAADLHRALAGAAKVRLISLDSSKRLCVARIEGPSSVFGDAHTEITFERRGRVLRKRDVGNLISKNKLISLDVLGRYADNLTQDATTMASVSKKTGIRRNFSDSSEIASLKKAFGGNRFITSQFESDAPILLADSLDDLAALRESEWHHFEAFRSALHNSFEEVDNDSIEERIRDVFLPELIKIERIFEKNRTAKGRDIIKNSGVAALAITSSIMTSGVSSLVAAAAGVLGAGHFAKEMVPAVRDYLSVPDEAKDSQFYFAWRLKEKQ